MTIATPITGVIPTGYAYRATRVRRRDGQRETLTWKSTPEADNWSAQAVADWVRDHLRFRGIGDEITVHVWRHRDVETQRRRTPEDATAFVFPAVRIEPEACRSGQCTHARRGEFCG